MIAKQKRRTKAQMEKDNSTAIMKRIETSLVATDEKAIVDENVPNVSVLYLPGDEVKVTLTIANKSYTDNTTGPTANWYTSFMLRAAKEILTG